MLLKTRFYLPPIRKNSVVRRRLIDRLDATSGGELILVSAPPGYGKTTLLSQWLHESPHIFGWVVLDFSQSTPSKFWSSIVNAISAAQPGIGEQAKQLLREDNIDLSSVIISLLNDLDSLSTLNSASPLTLVLDDFHKIDHKETLKSFNLFLDHLPSAIRIAITSRQQPPLNLSRRRANHQLKELNHHDLTLDEREGEAFLNDTMKLDLSRDEANKIISTTEGWVAGLQLVGLTLQKNTQNIDELLQVESPKHGVLIGDISDYLFDEVFSLQPQSVQNFLIKTAYPSQFCAALANYLQNDQASYSMIKQIDQSNLFLVPLDNHQTWFRYHDSFRQFLLQRFAELGDKEQDEIHQKAKSWLDDGGYVDITLGQIASNAAGLNAEENSKIEPNHLAFDIEPLTKREQQVMACLKEGYSNKEIAEALHISLNTLKVHIRNLYGKIGVENRSQALVKMANHSTNNP